jgi:hypothetical protein
MRKSNPLNIEKYYLLLLLFYSIYEIVYYQHKKIASNTNRVAHLGTSTN